MGIGHGQTDGRDNGGAWQQARKLRLIRRGHVEGREATFFGFMDVNIIGLHQDLQFLSATMIRSFSRMRSSSSAEDKSAHSFLLPWFGLEKPELNLRDNLLLYDNNGCFCLTVFRAAGRLVPYYDIARVTIASKLVLLIEPQ